MSPPTWDRRHPFDAGHPPDWATGWGEDDHGPFVEFAVERVVQRMRWIPGGPFMMGAEDGDEEAFDSERPRHEVVLERGFWLGDTPVTQALWRAATGKNPAHFHKGEDAPQRPVEQVSHEDCLALCAALSDRLPGPPLRLPTEAEWERACKGGQEHARWGLSADAVGWYEGNSGRTTHPVGQKAPNPWGLYDMLGNVNEWVQDVPMRYPEVEPLYFAADRGIRGGAWDNPARGLRAAFRLAYHPSGRLRDLGCRLARGPALPASKAGQ